MYGLLCGCRGLTEGARLGLFFTTPHRRHAGCFLSVATGALAWQCNATPNNNLDGSFVLRHGPSAYAYVLNSETTAKTLAVPARRSWISAASLTRRTTPSLFPSESRYASCKNRRKSGADN